MNHFSKFSVFKQMPCLIRSFASRSYLQGGGSKEIVRLGGGKQVFKNVSVIRTFAEKSSSKGGGDKKGEEGDKKEKCSGGSSGSSGGSGGSGSKSPPKSCSSGQPKAKPKPKDNPSCRRGPGESHFQAAKWRKISLSVLPAILVLTIFTFATMHKHERPEFVPYEHLRKRDKKFCWGDGNHTFFHNKHLNALPEGYEDE